MTRIFLYLFRGSNLFIYDWFFFVFDRNLIIINKYTGYTGKWHTGLITWLWTTLPFKLSTIDGWIQSNNNSSGMKWHRNIKMEHPYLISFSCREKNDKIQWMLKCWCKSMSSLVKLSKIQKCCEVMAKRASTSQTFSSFAEWKNSSFWISIEEIDFFYSLNFNHHAYIIDTLCSFFIRMNLKWIAINRFNEIKTKYFWREKTTRVHWR